MGVQTRSGLGLPSNIALPQRYRVVRRIAHGGMASVWCADDTALGRKVAIKLLAERYVHDAGVIARFGREARAAARLSGHPHVITIFDVGEADVTGPEAAGPRPFIVMEYLSGGTVADALRVGEVTREQALAWLRETAGALDYAHSHGVVHRDIKPGNLLLDQERRLHVADFGIARVAAEDTLTGTGQLFGTAAYLSPEQALGKPATEAGDRYALAIVAFELLTGTRPFTAEHFAAQARQHIEAEPPSASVRNPALPETVDAVLTRGMAKRPEDRWPTAAAFVDAIVRALRARPRPARTRRAFAAPAPPAQPIFTSSRAKPSPRVVALAALAAVAFLTGATAGAISGGSSRSTRSSVQATAPRHGVVSGAHRRRHVVTAAHTTTSTTTTTTVSATSAPTATGVPASAPAPPPTADALEARGHQLMLDGNYGAAIPVLRQAVASAAPGSLTYAYALYDLGRSLRLSGDPQAAAVVLQKRLQIPNQTGVVRQELELALRAIGAKLHGSGDAGPPPPGKEHGHRPGPGHDGGN